MTMAPQTSVPQNAHCGGVVGRSAPAAALLNNFDARELALAGLHDDRRPGWKRERLVAHHLAIDLEAALRDEPQRFGRRLDESRLFRQLCDRRAGAHRDL